MIPARYGPVLFSLILSGTMSLLVSGIATYRTLALQAAAQHQQRGIGAGGAADEAALTRHHPAAVAGPPLLHASGIRPGQSLVFIHGDVRVGGIVVRSGPGRVGSVLGFKAVLRDIRSGDQRDGLVTHGAAPKRISARAQVRPPPTTDTATSSCGCHFSQSIESTEGALAPPVLPCSSTFA